MGEIDDHMTLACQVSEEMARYNILVSIVPATPMKVENSKSGSRDCAIRLPEVNQERLAGFELLPDRHIPLP